MSNLLNNLNPAQKEAVKTTEGPLLLLAGAGSGKTGVLTKRIAYLIENGVRPFNIMAITFTNKAAGEMKQRVAAATPYGNDVWISTFHSSCVRILRREINILGYETHFSIYDADDSQRLIKDILKKLNINEKNFSPKSIANEISSLKNNLISAASYKKTVENDYRMKTISNVYTKYQSYLKQNNALDFDDLIFKTVQIFMQYPDILEKYQERFKYILIDEYQDTNACQYSLIRLLSAKYKNICVVGDDDQSIYGFRGADIRNILNFEKDFTGAAIIKLEQNYRSTETILKAANNVIKNNIGRKSKTLWTDKGKGEKIKFYRANNDLDETLFIADEIKKAVENGGKYSDFAILYRNNSLSRTIEDRLVKNAIPYRLFGGVPFYSRKEIKDVLGYMKLLYNPYDNTNIQRIINVPKRGIGASTLDKLTAFADENNISLYESLFRIEEITELKTRTKKINEFINIIEELKEFSKTSSIYDLINEILSKTGYINELQTEGTEEANGRIENLNELLSKAIEFENISEEPSLSSFLEEVALVADIDNYSEDSDTVVLMTIHSSKGLEFPTVFLIGFEEGIFPSYRSTLDPSPSAVEEERRLCYVAITRAKEKLYITCAKSRLQNGQYNSNLPSRFFDELPMELLETYSLDTQTNKKHLSDFQEVKIISGAAKTSSFKHHAEYSTKGAENYNNTLAPKNVKIDFEVGDKIKQIKYGVGTVIDIMPAGADFEITVEFPLMGKKKFMAALSKLQKI